MAKATRLSRITILGGMNNLCKSDGTAISDYSPRIREFGGGRKLLEEKDLTLLTDLELLIESSTLGDPESPLKWTSKSIAKLAAGLNQEGHRISHKSVYNLLESLGYSLQSNRKTRDRESHLYWDAQFLHIRLVAK